MIVDKEEFLKEFGDDYGYPNGPKSVDEIRATEFKRLEDSQSDASVITSDIIRDCRQQVLDYFNASAKEYKCIFTSGTTAALKLVGEAFPWTSKSHYIYTMENHNSVIGIREYALSKGAAAAAVDVEEFMDESLSRDSRASFKLSQHSFMRRNKVYLKEEYNGKMYHLFAFPSECNFSGVKFNHDLVSFVKEHLHEGLEGSAHGKDCCLVLIDAAKGCATDPLNLSKCAADFVVMSFYKIFGYPTGLGALLVRNEAAKLLKKTYFSGGTVAASIADMDYAKQRKGIEEQFEDGTVSFLSIASIRHGFNMLNSLTISAINRHTASLARYLRRTLLALKHDNGAEVCVIYGGINKVMGPTISFNLKRSDGSWIGYLEVEKLASLSGIQLRTGCFCNPGACSKYIGLSHLELLSNSEAGRVCWDDNDIINGKPTGAVRVSFGYFSTFEDVKKFVDFVMASFVSLPRSTGNGLHPQRDGLIPAQGGHRQSSNRKSYLKSITVYPIKSCGGFTVDTWPLSHTGLQHDREWLLKNPNGEILTQKKVPEMCLINTYINLEQGMLCVESPRCKAKLQIVLELDSNFSVKEEMDMHSQRYEVLCYDEHVNSWFSDAVGRPCMLFRCSIPKHYSNKRYTNTCRDVETTLSFVNEAQFLLISEVSITDLNNRLCSKAGEQKGLQGPLKVSSMRFRPNLVISGGDAYSEDKWRNIRIGDKNFLSLGGCNRCQMINQEYEEGIVGKSKEPLATLASYRRVKVIISNNSNVEDIVIVAMQ
ncbi:hypothetical protein V2J09_017585 [Rumex salicifolius]